jgi:hypothetical protein
MCCALRPDLGDPEQVRLVVSFTLETFRRLDYAFNNDGTSGENRLLADQTKDNCDYVFAVNPDRSVLRLSSSESEPSRATRPDERDRLF